LPQKQLNLKEEGEEEEEEELVKSDQKRPAQTYAVIKKKT
jgi:hypothetical protein